MTPAPRLESLAVIGTGLIGTSIAFAARAGGVSVTLFDSDGATLARAVDLGAGEAGEPAWADPDEPGAPGDPSADLVVVATPPGALPTTLHRAQIRNLGCTYTDVGSVKVRPLDEARHLGCDLTTFVGGHPMAGRERSGPGAARADLFVGRPWILTPGRARDEHQARVEALVRLCGALPVVLTPREHDEAVALVSHVPQVVSSLLAARLRDASDASVALAGQGVRDVTRIAGSDPGLWTGILDANARPVRAILAELRDDLTRMIESLDALAAEQPETSAGIRHEVGEPRRPREVVADLLSDGVVGRGRLPGKHGAPPTTYAAVPVVVSDRPGELARLLVDAGAAGVNVEDVSIEHSPGQPVGSVELAVRPAAADALTRALRERGWTVHR